jgi:hypothetical protein
MNKVAKKSAQEIQDEIFRNMSAEKKLELGAGLWRLAMQFAGDKMKDEIKRSKSAPCRTR